MRKSVEQETLSGTFQHLIWAPHGTVEGIMTRSADGQAQWVVGHKAAALAWHDFPVNAALEAEGEFLGWSSTKDDAHRVYSLTQLKSVNGKKPPAGKAIKRTPSFSGTVARINYARHGEPNGVILDSGDFIHMKPDGFKKLKLQVGDLVEADGDSHALEASHGYVVEATRVNGKSIR